MAIVVAVTGASGFVGKELVSGLSSRGFKVRPIIRSDRSSLCLEKFDKNYVALGEINSQTDWSRALLGVNCVVHCAARTEILGKNESDTIAEFRSVNVEGTQRLAEQAAKNGVSRLVFLSSLKVNGETTDGLSAPFGSLSDNANIVDASVKNEGCPVRPYEISKWEAEQVLWDISARTGLEVVVVRPPLIYGVGVKGNLKRLLALLRSGIPLPLAAVQNRRSLIGLENLVDLLICCVQHPAASGKVLLVSDGVDLSTPDLLRLMAESMGRPARLFPVPLSVLRFAADALGMGADIDRLVRSLQVDSSYARKVLNWTPPVSIRDGIQRMVQGT